MSVSLWFGDFVVDVIKTSCPMFETWILFLFYAAKLLKSTYKKMQESKRLELFNFRTNVTVILDCEKIKKNVHA